MYSLFFDKNYDMIKKISSYLVCKLLKKVLTSYTNLYNEKMPFIAVFGSVGKSSQTQLIGELFRKSDYKVFTTKKNTINGMGMMLGGFDLSFEKGGLFNKIKFILLLIKSILLNKYNLPIKSVIVMEIGFDHQGECDDWRDILTNNLGLAIVTALTDEHNLNYSNELNTLGLDKIMSFIPHEIEIELQNLKTSISTKNVIIEMLKPLEYTNSYIIPTEINKLSNCYYFNNSSVRSTENPEFRYSNNRVYIDEILVDDRFLLPTTFAKTLSIIEKVAKLYNIDKDIVRELIGQLSLPNGRFSKLAGKNSSTIIDSSYNSDPDSVFGFLDSIRQTLINQNSIEYDLIKHNIVLGEMRELGDVGTTKHGQVLDKLIELKKDFPEKIENIILLGIEWDKLNETQKLSRDGNVKKILFHTQVFNNYDKVADIVSFYNNNLRPQSWNWIKGSQNTIFLEVLVENLLANPADKKLLCRQEPRWFEMRKDFEF